MSWTDTEQAEHRAAFIKECRQKAWGAACEADFIDKQLDQLMVEYGKLKNEEAEIATAPDHHTMAKREKRNQLIAAMKLLNENLSQGQQRIQSLFTTAEHNLAVAKHAEGWGWIEHKDAAIAIPNQV